MSASVLVVDDNLANLMLACEVLELGGHPVLRAANALEALAVVERSKPALILMDISMPGMDGLTLTRQLKADPGTRDIVIIALTASAMKGDELRVANAGCDGYITKPIDTRTFATQVGVYLAAGPRRHKQVLVVDDNAANRKLLRAILESEPVDVVEAADGIEALEILERQPVDAVISDILMPRMDGYRLCFEVRKSERLRALPFIFYTSTYTSPGDQKLALDLGADRYITKPASAQTIVDAIRALELSRGPVPVPRITGQLENVLIKEYSQQLVAKLEERNEELTELTLELRSTHEKLHHLLAHSPAVIYGLKLEDGKVIPHVVSDNITEVLGFSVQEALTFEWWKGQLHPDDLERTLASLTETAKNGASRTEYRIRHKDGSWRWVEDSRRLVLDSDGTPREIVGVWSDITERKKLEADVSLRDRRLSAFFSNATAGLCILDPDQRYLQINETLAQMNGVPAPEHLGRTVAEVLPDIAPTLVPIIQRVLATREPVLNTEVSGSMPGQPGVTRHFMASFFPLTSDQGESSGVGCVAVEITERKAAEEGLRLSELRFRQLAENIQEVFWMTNPDMTEMIYVSPAYETIWGRSVERLYADPHEWMDAIVPEDRPRVIEAFGSLATGAPRVSIEYRIRQPDGSVHWLLDRGFPIRDESGKLYRTAGIAKDITEQKQLEESLRRAHKMEAIGQLAGGIAHDFNNILGCILGYTELAVLNTAGNAAAQSDLQEVLKASQRAKELVLQILTFSRQQEQERLPLDPRAPIREALKLLRATLPATIEIQSDLGHEPLLVVADATQIHQIVMNLATNAVHAMGGRGKLQVELAAVQVDAGLVRELPDLQAGPYVRLSIRDTGSGMDPATLQRIFEPFFTTKAPGEGTGLGLAVVHGIVKAHEGAIGVASEPGRGTQFRIYFPAHAGEAAGAGPASAAPQSGSGEHVLYVDDEPMLAQLGSLVLRRAGYQVTARTNPTEALAAFREQPGIYDLVVTDLTMPGMSGLELAAELLKLRPSVLILLTTGFGGAMTATKARSLGIRELLLKPFDADALVASVHQTLAPTRQADA